jgi:hypothetical protein
MIPRAMSRVVPAFTAASIGHEVNRGRTRAGWTVPKTTEMLGKELGQKWSRPYWYKKIAGSPAFTLEELGILATVFGAPPGWPMVPWGFNPDRQSAPHRDTP